MGVSGSAAGFGLAALVALALFGGSTAVPARAETASQLDVMSQATDKSASGIALARKLIQGDDLLGAMATLERVLINNPNNLEARALHAGLLCRIDDRRGANVEFDTLRGLDIPPAVTAEARHPCQQPG